MRTTGIALFLLLTLFASAAQAQTYKNITVKITNTTNGIYFTPIVMATHGIPNAMFEVGAVPSQSIEGLAEFALNAGLIGELAALNSWVIEVEDPTDQVVGPGESITATIVTGPGIEYLSLAGMLVPTNDAFVGLNSFRVPDGTGQARLRLNAYDAGTEENNELLACPGQPPFVGDPLDDPNIPGDPGSNNGLCGTGAQPPQGEVQRIHVHPGVVGDTDLGGGLSDLDSRAHRWQNPIAEVVIDY